MRSSKKSSFLAFKFFYGGSVEQAPTLLFSKAPGPAGIGLAEQSASAGPASVTTFKEQQPCATLPLPPGRPKPGHILSAPHYQELCVEYQV